MPTRSKILLKNLFWTRTLAEDSYQTSDLVGSPEEAISAGVKLALPNALGRRTYELGADAVPSKFSVCSRADLEMKVAQQDREPGRFFATVDTATGQVAYFILNSK